jgi:glycosyltransferase involved in cell wall biosynthesis
MNPDILLPGSVRSTKGYLRVIQLLPQIVKEVGVVTLRISGGFKKGVHKEFISDFRKAINDSPHADSIIFDDKWISENEYTGAIKNADLILLPFEAGNYKMNLNLALKYNKPVVCSDLIGFRNVAAKYKQMVIVESEVELLAAIKILLSTSKY